MINFDFLIPIAQASAEAVGEAAKEATDTGIAGTLGINLKLFIAQLFNFGLILLIFWKWVLPRVSKGLKDRTEKIEKSLKDAEDIGKSKQDFENWRTEETSKTRVEISSMISKAEKEAVSLKDNVLAQTKSEQEKIVVSAMQEIEEQKKQALTQVKSEVANLVVMATEKIIREKLSSEKDQKLIKETLESIK